MQDLVEEFLNSESNTIYCALSNTRELEIKLFFWDDYDCKSEQLAQEISNLIDNSIENKAKLYMDRPPLHNWRECLGFNCFFLTISKYKLRWMFKTGKCSLWKEGNDNSKIKYYVDFSNDKKGICNSNAFCSIFVINFKNYLRSFSERAIDILYEHTSTYKNLIDFQWETDLHRILVNHLITSIEEKYKKNRENKLFKQNETTNKTSKWISIASVFISIVGCIVLPIIFHFIK